MSINSQHPEPPQPDAARYARAAAEAIGAVFEDLDAGGGYLFRIARGDRSILAGAFGVCSYPVNGAAPYTIARDKAHTKTVLRAAGLPVIPGGLFFAHRRRVGMRGPGREIEDAVAFAAALGFPVFCKPNTGGRGNFAEIIPDAACLLDYAARIEREFESFLVEPVIAGAEHRIFIQDGEPVFWSAKAPAVLLGDGASSVAQLIEQSNAALEGTGVSPLPMSIAAIIGRDPREVPAAGEALVLPGRRNLAAAGGIEAVSEFAAPALAAPARAAARAIGLDIAAIDMFDISPKGDLSDLVVIEVNGNPGLKTLELAGRKDLILRIWTRMLERLLGN